MGSSSSAQKQNRNNGPNEHAKRSTRHSDKHEAPKQTTSKSTEVEATVGMKNRTLEANINNGPSNQRGRSFKAPTDKHSQTSANSEDQRKASGDEDFKRHASSKSKTAEWQIQHTGPNDDARTDDCGLPAMDAKDACISATPSTSREENRVETVNRHGEVSYTTKTEENHATTNETKKMHEYEKKVERLEAEIIKLTQEKDQLLNRQEPEVLEQVKENRENKPRKTKEKERSDEVSYRTKTNENHVIDSANDRKKIHEYEKKVERLEADVIKLTQEKDQLLNRQVPDVLEKNKNEDRENKPRKTKENERNDEVSYTAKANENHAIDSANDRKKIHEYEKKVERLEADVIKLTQEKDQLLNRQEPEVLEQVKENRENKPRKTKEKERSDEVSYRTKTNENHVIDSANDRKKIHEYEKKVERLEADVIKLTQEKDQLLNRQVPDVLEKNKNEDRENKPRKTKENERNDEVSYTAKANENHAIDSANDRKKIHEYEKKVERLEADVIKLTQEKDQLLNRQEPEVLEQVKENRENKPRKTKEKERSDEVSYRTKTNENHVIDSANDRKKIHEYEKKVERLEADVIKLTQEKDQLLNRQVPDVLEKNKNEDRENKPRKTKENERNDEVSYTAKANENHAIDSANDRKKIHEYEKKVERLEADVIKLTQEKDQLLNRQEPEVLEQVKENRENKPRKTKEKERSDEVSYRTKTNENHVIDSANDRKKIHEYEKKVERLEADVIKLTQEKDQLLNRQVPDVLEKNKNEDRENKPRKTKENERNDEVSYTTKANENHAIDSANNRKKIHEYEKKVERLEADVIKLTQEKDQLLNRKEQMRK